MALLGSGLAQTSPVLAKIALPVATTAPNHYDLTLTEGSFSAGGEVAPQIAINGGFPGPNLVLRQGQAVTITVTNRLTRETSIHWHGLLIPPAMDGAVGFNRFKAIGAGETFTYSFTPRHSGTYWYHSHTGLQEQEGLYGAITILPPLAEQRSQPLSRDLVAVISDRFAGSAEQGLANSIKNAAAMGGMQGNSESSLDDPHAGHQIDSADQLDPGLLAMTRDLADAQGLEFLVNGEPANQPQSFIYKNGERLRLRLINAAGNSIFDLWVQGLPMTIIAVDGAAVKPVTVDEFRFMPGQTYDILVTPTAGLVYPLIAESIDRSGRAVAVITPREGLDYSLPPTREKTRLSDADFSDQFVEKMDWTPTPSSSGHEGHMTGMEDMEDMDSMAGMDDMGTMAGKVGMGDTSTAD
ncbi:MAG: multicopper oxidase domain-containing protein, partial [Alphaproteobacteria bacterium]|nr:multicopper oxidase domain-containing protein [Alphaproteobacteria bacterium]